MKNYSLWFRIGVAAVVLFLAAVLWPWSYPDKMWLHRVNSLEKYDKIGVKYSGIEVDIVLREAGIPDVTHDEDVSDGLSLDGYFSRLKGTEKRIWLDVKNLTDENADDFMAWLGSEMSKADMGRERVVIESPEWKTLGKFTRSGYYTSCYVDLEKPSRLSETQIRHCTDSLGMIAGSGNVCALSFPYWWYSSIRKWLDSDIDLLTWAHRSTPLELFLTPMGWRMLGDPQLSVILVKEKL